MAETILMPKQGNTVESCIILEWKKEEGQAISEGEILCEVETDKATIEVESTATGTLLKRLYEVDDDVPVQVPIAIVGEQGEDISGLLDELGSGSSASGPAEEKTQEPQQSSESQPVAEKQTTQEAPAQKSGQSSFVSPRARNTAAKLGVDPTTLSGSGAKGRVIEQDVLAAAQNQQPLTPAAKDRLSSEGLQAPAQGSGIGGRVRASDLAASTEAPAPQEISETAYRDVPVRSIRKITAQRMRESLSTTAQLTLHSSADARALKALRKRLKNSRETLGLNGVTINDLVLYAVARTLKAHPEINSHFLGDTIREFGYVNLGFAVDTPRGLMVPVIKHADRLTLQEISVQAKALNERCQSGKIDSEDLDGGTATVTNLGSLGVEMFTPVLNTPQAAIVGICSIEPKPVETSDGVEFIPHLGISMTCDHQAIDGAPAARFLKELTDNIASIDLLLAL
ncbi:MAG: dihydrolipoamide acetyltransferase family protein [Spirochaetota bacterium]